MKNCSRVSRKWVDSKRICFTVSGSPQKAQDGGSSPKVGTSVLCDSDQLWVSCTVVWRHCDCEFCTDYKYLDSNQL